MALAIRPRRAPAPLLAGEPPRWRRLRRGQGLARLRRSRDVWRPALLAGAALAWSLGLWWRMGWPAPPLPPDGLALRREYVATRTAEMPAADSGPAGAASSAASGATPGAGHDLLDPGPPAPPLPDALPAAETPPAPPAPIADSGPARLAE